MFESMECAELPPSFWHEMSDFELEAMLNAKPHLRRHYEPSPDDLLPVLDPCTESWLRDQPPDDHEPVYLEPDPPLSDRQPETFSDAEALARLIEVEEAIAGLHAQRARLVSLVAANRPAAADRPAGVPGARAATPAEGDDAESGAAADTVPEVLDVSEWLPHELQMAHPYSLTAAQDLVETSMVLTGRLTATLALLDSGRIDYQRARVLTDLLSSTRPEVAHTVEAMVLPKAPGLTPGGLASAVRRALARVDAAALRRRHARARRSATWLLLPNPRRDGSAGRRPPTSGRRHLCGRGRHIRGRPAGRR